MALQLISVSHHYGGRPALTDLNLRVEAGDCYGFIGHNGAGKSTAMRIALGLIKPSQGSVIVDGFDLSKSAMEVRARMGGLIETPGFFDHLGSQRNLQMLAMLQGMTRSESLTEAERLLDVVGLPDVARLHVGAFSQGMRQRLGIAQALIGSPRYILLDEPGNGLDPEGLAEMRRLIKRLTRDEGITVLISSHQLHEIAEICNRIGVLKKGRLLVEDDAKKLLRGDGRLLIESSERERARSCLVELGCKVVEEEESLLVDPEGQPAAQLSRALVAADIPLEAIRPKPASLEEIYLAIESQAPSEPQLAEEAATDRSGVAERIAPGMGLWRALRWEFQRMLSRPRHFLIFVLPFALAWYNIFSRHAEAVANAKAVAAGEIMSSTQVTAFEGIAFGLRSSLYLAAAILCAFASQSLSSELDRGTLRNVFLRPLQRWMVVLGKFLAFASLSAFIYVSLMAFVAFTAGRYFAFEGVTEILPNDEVMDVLKVDVLWDAVRELVKAGAIPFMTFTAIGFVAGAVVRSGAAAFALSLGSLFLFDLGRAISREFDLDRWMPPAHMPSVLSDTSFLLRYQHVVTNVSNASETLDASCLLVWMGMSLLISLVVVTWRDLR